MKSSKQNKDQDLIFEAYASHVRTSKFNTVVDEAKKKIVKTPAGRRLFQGIGKLARKATDKLGITKPRQPGLQLKGDTKVQQRLADQEAKEAAEKAARERAETIAAAKKKAGEIVDTTVDATKDAAGAAVDLGRAGVNFASPYVTQLASGGYRLAGKGVNITFNSAKDMAKWIGNNPGKATSLGLGGTAVGTSIAIAPSVVKKGKEVLGVEPEVVDQIETKTDILNAVKNSNPKFSGMTPDEIAATDEGIAALKAAGLGSITPTIGPPKGFFAGRYLDDQGQLKGARVAGDLAVGTAGAIGAKLAYDYLKPKKDEDEEKKKKSLYTASYNPQQSKSGYDIIT